MHSQKGVVIIESLIAILIFSIGILALVGLQAAMVKNTSDSKYRSEASYIAQQRIGQIWADPTNAATYLETDTDIGSLLPSGKRTVTSSAVNRYTVTITWQSPGGDAHNYITSATITGD